MTSELEDIPSVLSVDVHKMHFGVELFPVFRYVPSPKTSLKHFVHPPEVIFRKGLQFL